MTVDSFLSSLTRHGIPGIDARRYLSPRPAEPQRVRMRVVPVAIDWRPTLSIYASEPFLKAVQ